MDGSSQSPALPDRFDDDAQDLLADRRSPARAISGNLIAAAQTAIVPLVFLTEFQSAVPISTVGYVSGLLLVCGFAIAAIHWSASWTAGGFRQAGEEMIRRALHVAALVFLVTIASTLGGEVSPAHTGRTFTLLVAIAWAGIGLSTIGGVLNRRQGVECVMVLGHGKRALYLSQLVKREMPWAKVCIWPVASLPSSADDPAFDIQACAHPAIVEQAPDVALISDDVLNEATIAALSAHLAPLAIDVLVNAPHPAQRRTGEIVSFAGLPCVRVFPQPLKFHQRAMKRAFDIAASLVLILLLLPLLGLIALIIKLDSRGPVLFSQPRVGRHGAYFTIWKFRTMASEAADRLALNPTVANDPRVTRVGAKLRKTSLDELPQLFNVLAGSMSLVGPRPHAMNGNQFSSVMANYPARHRVKPGITGLAQVKGWRGPTDTLTKIEQRTANDLRYIGEWSLQRDVVIIARTAFALYGRNAF
jgi:exopolysaccharide biosynthesis polyprenyl glycosylphosphotransferase